MTLVSKIEQIIAFYKCVSEISQEKNVEKVQQIIRMTSGDFGDSALRISIQI
jgi:hypothetical protein